MTPNAPQFRPPLPATPDEMAFLRRAFARLVVAKAGVDDPRIEAAFAAVPREAFLGRRPWHLPTRGAPVMLPPDPVLAYQDAVIALLPGRGINNGEPSLHARMIAALGLREGERVAHLGAGTGYFSAILARLVGESGHVLAVEHEAGLAGHAERTLAGDPQVRAITGDGLALDLEGFDAVYVSFAVEDYPKTWLAALARGTRILAPLGARTDGPGHAFATGAAYLLAPGEGGVAARFVSPAFFICAEGAEPVAPDHRARLARAFAEGRPRDVSRLVLGRGVEEGEGDVFFAGEGWALCR